MNKFLIILILITNTSFSQDLEKMCESFYYQDGNKKFPKWYLLDSEIKRSYDNFRYDFFKKKFEEERDTPRGKMIEKVLLDNGSYYTQRYYSHDKDGMPVALPTYANNLFWDKLSCITDDNTFYGMGSIRLILNDHLLDINPREPQRIVSLFFALLVRYSEGSVLLDYLTNNIDFSTGTLPGLNIRYDILEGEVIAIASGMNNNCNAEIVIDVRKWERLDNRQRAWTLFHELFHDIFNLEHGESLDYSNQLMYPIIAPEGMKSDWEVINELKKTIRYIDLNKKNNFEC